MSSKDKRTKSGRPAKSMAAGGNSNAGLNSSMNSNPVNSAFQQVQLLSNNPQMTNQSMSQLGQTPLQTNQYAQFMNQLPQNGPLNNLSSSINTQDFYQPQLTQHQQLQQQAQQLQQQAQQQLGQSLPQHSQLTPLQQQAQSLGMNDDHFRAIQQLQQQQAQAQAQVQAQAQQIQQLQAAAAAAAAAAGNNSQMPQGLQQHSPHAQHQNHNLPISQQLQQHQLQQQQLQQQQLQQQQLQQQQLQQLQLQHHQSPHQQQLQQQYHAQQPQQHLQQQYQSHPSIQHQALGLTNNMGLGATAGGAASASGSSAGTRQVGYNDANHLHSKYLENEIIRTFSTRQDLIEFVKNTLNAEEQCRIVINSSKPKAIYLQCERAGSFRTTVKDSSKRQRVAYTKRNKCAYRLVANLYPADKDKKKQKKENGLDDKLHDFEQQRAGNTTNPDSSKFDPDTDLWILRMINPNHNHAPDMADVAKRKKLKSVRVLVEKPVPRPSESPVDSTSNSVVSNDNHQGVGHGGHGVYGSPGSVQISNKDVINPAHYNQIHHQQLHPHQQSQASAGHHQEIHDPDVLAAITNNPAAAAAAAALNPQPVDSAIDPNVDPSYSRS